MHDCFVVSEHIYLVYTLEWLHSEFFYYCLELFVIVDLGFGDFFDFSSLAAFTPSTRVADFFLQLFSGFENFWIHKCVFFFFFLFFIFFFFFRRKFYIFLLFFLIFDFFVLEFFFFFFFCIFYFFNVFFLIFI